MSLTKKEMLQLSYFMARAHVAGQADGNYHHWSAIEGMSPAISENAIKRMGFAIRELALDKGIRALMLDLLTDQQWIASLRREMRKAGEK